MAGNWASALGQAILGGQNAFVQAQGRERQKGLDTQQAEEHALQIAQLKQLIAQQPKTQAAARAKTIADRDGALAAFNNPDFLAAQAEAGTPVQTRKSLGPVQDPSLAPDTGAVLPESVVAAQTLARQQAAARQAMLSGTMGKQAQLAAIAQEGGIKDGMSELLKLGPQPTFHALGPNQHGVVFDPATNTMQNLGGGPSGGAAASVIPEGPGGEDFLAKLDPARRRLVDLYGRDYNGQLPASRNMMDPKWLSLQDDIQRAYPGWDAGQYPQRQAMRKDFASGKTAGNIKSLNQLVAHVDEYSKAVESLGNTGYKSANWLKNTWGDQTGNPALSKFGTSATAVAEEGAALFKISGATDTAINAWKENLQGNAGIQAQRQAAQTILDLLDSRIGILQDQWRSGAGGTSDFPVLYPHAQEVLTRLKGRPVDKRMPALGQPAPGALAPAPGRAPLTAQMPANTAPTKRPTITSIQEIH